MICKILDSGSKSNGYILTNGHEALIIEAGCPVRDVLKAVNFKNETIVGCIVSHAHGDHSKHIKDYQKLGIEVYLSAGAAFELKNVYRRTNVIKHRLTINLGGFVIVPFNTHHDCAEPLGFLINHPDIGRLLFATDTSHLDYIFKNLTTIMIESNYSPKTLKKQAENGDLVKMRYDRIINNHMSIDTAIKTMKQFDMSNVKNIILLHLSDDNSDENAMVQEVVNKFGIETRSAKKGIEINLNVF